MRRKDWTPAVLVTATVSLTVVSVVLLTTPWLRDSLRGSPGPERARRALPNEVEVWVGDLGDGLRAVLSAVWGDPEPDLEHDKILNDGLALAQGERLAYYRLLLFNTSREARTVSLSEGAFTIHPPNGGSEVPLRSLAALVARGEATPSPALHAVLKSLGTLRESVIVPAGEMAPLVVAFSTRVELEEAVGVASVDGSVFRRRRMTRRALEALLSSPDEAHLKDL